MAVVRSYAQEIERLYRQEYGSKIEFALRVSGIAAGAVVLYYYTHWSIALWWMAGYFGLLVVNFYFLRAVKDTRHFSAVLIGIILNAVLLSEFATLPTWLLLQDDVTLRYSATTALFCLAIYMLWRSDEAWLLLAFKVLLAAAIITVTLIKYVPASDYFYGQVAMVVIGFAGLGYFLLALNSKKIVRDAHMVATERSVHAQKMEAVGQLAGGVAHDFNNILTAIQGNLELYHFAEDEEDRRALIQNSTEATQRAAALVRQLLAYSRHSELVQRKVSIDPFFDSLLSLTRRVMPASVDISFQCSDADLAVLVDEDQLITAMVNLIVNASDAMDGGGSITIAAAPCLVDDALAQTIASPIEPGDYVALMITDTGHGIAPEMLLRVTEPFFTTKPVGKGSGLGLAMVAGFAEQSGGGLRIDSTPDGTTVTIYLRPA